MTAATQPRTLPGPLPADTPLLGTIRVPPGMVGDDTEAYVLICDGDCLSPEANDGDYVVASPNAPLARGKLGVLYPKGGKPALKKMVMVPPPSMMTAHPDSELMPLVIFEQLNPPRGYLVTVDKLEAVHGVLGVIPKDEVQFVSRAAAQ